MQPFIKNIAATIVVAFLMAAMPVNATAQCSDLSKRLAGLERDLGRLVQANIRLAEAIEALQQMRQDRQHYVNYQTQEDVGSTARDQLVIRAYGNAHLRIALQNGGFIDVRGSASRSSVTMPSDSSLARNSRYRVTHAPMPIASNNVSYRPRGYLAGPPNGSRILVPSVW